MKTAKLYIESYKDTGLGDVGHDLGFDNKKTSKIFEYGEYVNLKVIIDEDLNIIGGRIIPYKKDWRD